ncbi:RNA polymerase sigma factor [Tundrisphaera sp. TA3]|uniref:RNA polymerase sigma factor n=1 Tax=Tundrisphaera sp. TA3 TaxID=3435775 RepID=UPI003EBA0CDD
MSMDRDDALIDEMIRRLNRGDEAAVGDVFETYVPFLRMVVRRRLSATLRSKLDSEDIVQSIWVDLLDLFREGGDRFPDAARLQAFLARAARNRLIDRQRQHAAAMDRERPASGAELDAVASPARDRPSEAVHADELWDSILASCPPQHRELFRMKREGRSLAEMADRSRMHPSSIRRVFYDMAGRLGVEKKQRESSTG